MSGPVLNMLVTNLVVPQPQALSVDQSSSILRKVAKLDKKLKMVELQLKKLKIDKTGKDDVSDPIESEGTIITDRNELMKKLMKKD